MAGALEPFRYPKSRHIRRISPGPYQDYKSYKRHLAEEFRGQCVYCRMPHAIKGPESFGVDHYRPVKVFPALRCEYSNLYFACAPCNSRKGSYWPVSAGPLIPNPCDDEMKRHLCFDGPRVVSESSRGDFAEKLLDLNAPDVVAHRTDILWIIREAQQKRHELEEMKRGSSVEVLLEIEEALDAVASVLRRHGIPVG